MQFLPKVLPHVYGAGKAVSFLFRNDRLVKDPNKETLEHFMYNRKYTKVSDLLTFFFQKKHFLGYLFLFYAMFIMWIVTAYIVHKMFSD